MANRKTRETVSEQADMQMTPMIDVTFLLLIFFLCSIRFKLLDGKLAAYLPREEGVNRTVQYVPKLEKIEIRLDRDERAPGGFLLSVNGTEMSSLQAFGRTLEDYLGQDSGLEACCVPGEHVQYGHVVTVVNECLRAGLDGLTFSALPLEH
jgi:biopolymer transport protein ExbD